MDINSNELNGIAVIGMAGQFPKAKDIYQFWENIKNGRNCITYFTDQEIAEAGIDKDLAQNPNYVKAKGVLENIDLFDAGFFGINPREAELTDPQHRLLLECAWEALEHAGYACYKYQGSIGVFAGSAMNSYMLLNVYPHIKKEVCAGTLIAAIGNDKDSLTTLISYHLNLKGPAITIQSSSSTSLVAVSTACQSLLTYQCDMALAGGIAVGPPVNGGYLYEEGGILSPNGRCCTFDSKAKGFVPGMGMGLVVLKRLPEAIRDRDHIWAVIRGFAVNNDGSKKVSYSAPSVDGQAEVILEAQEVGDVDPETITYIEAHGTGTPLGDPVEVAALTQAFRRKTDKKQYCALGSVKTNIGHLDTAAGVAGLIKTCLALKQRTLPALINYTTPNPQIDFENSPFYVNTELKDWQTDGLPRRAGISSIGMGGTNAHVVLEELDDRMRVTKKGNKGYQIINFSAKTLKALENYTQKIVDFLKNNQNFDLSDVAYTFSVGRNEFPYRRAIVCRNTAELVAGVENQFEKIYTNLSNTNKTVAFMFTGQGSQKINMGYELYRQEKTFREVFDRCAAIYQSQSGYDIKKIIFSDQQDGEDVLKQTQFAQPALFIFEYALAKLLISWGIKPSLMIGHSLGEYVAACLSEVLSLESAIKIIIVRSSLMQQQKSGSMLAVWSDEINVQNLITRFAIKDLSISAVNTPELCVVSGETDKIHHLKTALDEEDIFCKLLKTSHAFHSKMMEPMLEHFAEAIKEVIFEKPQLPFISSTSGIWITEEEATNYLYWVKQVREPVRFSEGVKELLKTENIVLLEIGPDDVLASLAKYHLKEDSNQIALAAITSAEKEGSAENSIYTMIANLWVNGVSVDWDSYYSDGEYCRVPLPTYPFERKSYWYGDEKRVEQPISEESPKETVSFQPRPDLDNPYAPPINELEKEIIEIWQSLLGINPIGREDDFFDLGGHSLLATQILSRIEYKYRVRIPLKEIFGDFTVRNVANILQDKINNG